MRDDSAEAMAGGAFRFRARNVVIAALAIVLFAASPARAFCPSLPDGPESANVQNGIDRALCLQEELAAETQRLRQTKAFEIALQNLRQQQLDLQQRLLPAPSF